MGKGVFVPMQTLTLSMLGKISADNIFIYIYIYITCITKKYLPASVAQLNAPSDWRPGGCGFNPRRGWQHSFVEIDHEIFSTVILSRPLRRAAVSFWRKNVHNTG